MGDMPRPWLCASTRPGIRSCCPFPRTFTPGKREEISLKEPTAAILSPSIAIAPSRIRPFSFLRASVRTCLPRIINLSTMPAFYLQQDASQDAAGAEKPEGIQLRGEHRGGARGGDQPEPPVGHIARRGED